MFNKHIVPTAQIAKKPLHVCHYSGTIRVYHQLLYPLNLGNDMQFNNKAPPTVLC